MWCSRVGNIAKNVQLVETFLERHAIVAKPRTISELRWRLKQSQEKFGEIPL